MIGIHYHQSGIVTMVLKESLESKEVFLKKRKEISARQEQAVDQFIEKLLQEIHAKFASDSKIVMFKQQHPEDLSVSDENLYRSEVSRKVLAAFKLYEKKRSSFFGKN